VSEVNKKFPMLRIQDIVAKLAKTKLKETVKVLHSLNIVLYYIYEKDEAVDTLNQLYSEAVNNNGIIMPMYQACTDNQWDICNKAYKFLAQEYGEEYIQDIVKGEDPYYVEVLEQLSGADND